MPGLQPLTVTARPSRILLIGGVGAHLLAASAVLACGLSLWIKSGLLAALALALIRFERRHGSARSKDFVTGLELLDGRWRLETGDGVQRHARLIDGYAHPSLILLRFRLDNGQRRTLTLPPDAAEAEALRRLRVWLRAHRDETEPAQW